MEYYPIIYTRTKYCDYNDNFHLSPVFIDKSILIKSVMIAANELEYCDDGYMINLVISDKNCFVYGVYFLTCSLCETDASFKDFCRDEFNRKIGAFIGFAAKKESYDAVPVISLSALAEVYKKYIFPIWEEKIPLQSSLIPEPMKLNEEAYSPCDISCDYADNKLILFSDRNAEETGSITRNLLHMAINNAQKIVYCSRVTILSEIDKGVLTHAITTNEIVSALRYRREEAAKRQIAEEQEKKRKISIFQKISERLKKLFAVWKK